MAKIAYVLVRVLALYLATQAALQIPEAFARFGRFSNGWVDWVGVAIPAVLAALLWRSAAPLARAIVARAEPDLGATPDGEAIAPTADRLFANLLLAGLFVAGVAIGARGLTIALAIAGQSIAELGGGGPIGSWFDTYAGSLAASAGQIVIGWYLVFRARIPRAVLMSARDRALLDENQVPRTGPLADDEDERIEFKLD